MAHGQVRIIGGQWRGRKLKVLDLDGLRPTPDRIRETLFNWLQPIVLGARCLDMFAGCGALGFEALSRGASYVVMVDKAAIAIDLLREELQRFGASNAEIYQADVPKQLRKPPSPFDLVFLDPPFESDLLLKSCTFLEDMGFLSDEAYIYLESKRPIVSDELPENWEIIKEKKAGFVSYQLALRHAK